MSTDQLFIPEKVKVGFQKREGTYTGKLAYVIYYDQKGKLRKEASWKSWRHDNIEPLDLSNEPIEGFVLNKGVGGARQSYGWNARNEYIRVYDPRDFEFEISVANLLFILRECDCSRGKGLEGKFVYAWSGTELVLLPVCSSDYQNSVQFTQLKAQSVHSKDLVEGASYLTKDQRVVTFLGRFDYHFALDDPSTTAKKNREGFHKKKYIWWNGARFEGTDNPRHIGAVQSEEPVPNYAELVDQYYKSPHGSKAVGFELVDDPEAGIYTQGWYSSNWFSAHNGYFLEHYTYNYGGRDGRVDVRTRRKICLDESGRLIINYRYDYADSRNIQPQQKGLLVVLESGTKCKVDQITIL